jgi:23S rRNA pseudouridine1911/1915/1917 synthase
LNTPIIYEDDSIIIFNKPSGLASQEGKNNEISILNSPSLLEKGLGDEAIVHRLDQRVTGLILFAKNKEILSKMNAQFQNRTVKKIYRAVVSNKPPKETDELTHWLLKDEKRNLSKAYQKEVKYSKKAVLSYKLLQSSERYHLLEIELMTGRHHQIRSQFAAINCPIVGDLKYGYKRSSLDGSIFLHSYKLTFIHPKNNQEVAFEAPMPEIWKKFGF